MFLDDYIPARQVSAGQFLRQRVDAYAGAHIDRQRRFEARSARRWGDWFILDVPTPVLWITNGYATPCEEIDFVSPFGTDIWP